MLDPITPISVDQLPQIIQIFKNDEMIASESFFDIQIERKRSNPNYINSEDELKHAVEYISKVEDFQRDLIKRIIQVLSGLKMSIKGNQSSHSNYETVVERLQETIHQLKQQISSLEELLQKEEYNNDNLRKQLEEYQEKIEELTRSEEQEKQKKMEQQGYNTKVMDNNRQFQMKIKMLEEENAQVMKHLFDGKIKMEAIAAQTMEKEIKISELEKKIQNMEHRLELEKEKRDKVEAKLEEKKEIINRMMEQREEMEGSTIHKQQDTADRNKGSLIRSFAVNRESLVGIPVPISNELGDGIDQMVMDSFRDRYHEIETINPEDRASEEDLNGQNVTQAMMAPTVSVALNESFYSSSGDKMKKSIRILDDHPVTIKKQRTQPSFFNPYLAHYTLSCQSIKIMLAEEGKRIAEGVNMESKYKQLLSSKVQVHHWGDWIRKTMLEGASAMSKIK